MYLRLILIDPTVFHIAELLLKDPEVVLKTLHYFHNHWPQIKHIVVFVVSVHRADLTDKLLVATLTHLGHRKTVERADLCWGRSTSS